MNALYVTVSIPFLLVLAGFNHAHGLTTFGKSPSNNAPPPQVAGLAKSCTNHSACRVIQGTSCVVEARDHTKKSCLCGDNTNPVNGKCTAEKRAPYHLCTDTSQCVSFAECKPSKNGENGEKVCECVEGFIAGHSYCSGGATLSILSGLLVLLITMSRIL